MKKVLITAILIAGQAFAAFAYGPSSADGGLPGEFLSYFTSDARAAAMGNAYTAAFGGSAGVYFNPSIIAGAGIHNIDALYTPLPMGGNFSSFFYSASVNLQIAAGIGIVSLNSGDEIKRNIWGRQDGTFSSSRKAAYVTGAYLADSKTAAGMNLKFVRHSMDGKEDSGIGLDGGIRYEVSEKVSLGFAAQNILPPELKLKDSPEKFPLNLRGGLSYSYFPERVIFSADAGVMDISAEPVARWMLGAEYTLLKYLKLRAGINYKELSGGVGVATKDFSFSYAVRYSDLGLFNMVSTSYRFGMLPSARERELRHREQIMAQKEERFEDWKKEREKVLLKNLDEQFDIVEREQELVQKRRRELDALVEAALSVKSGEYEEAEKQLLDILKSNPGSKDATTLLGIVQEELKREFSFNRMTSAYNRGEYEAALAESKKADPSHPQYEEARVVGLLSSARINIFGKKYELAEKDLNLALELRPDSSAAEILLERIKRLKELSK
ncbi:MAG: hypothetical protein U9R36_00775 [Elusimicrobiota bacterium]|nr:hypothetical protein [Elusimicrobiota bacterium]